MYLIKFWDKYFTINIFMVFIFMIYVHMDVDNIINGFSNHFPLSSVNFLCTFFQTTLIENIFSAIINYFFLLLFVSDIQKTTTNI